MSAYLKNLKEAVAALHGCECSHSETSRVVEFWEGSKVFNGDVETFTLSGHPKASDAFAWAFDNGTEAQYVAVLKEPPINDPGDAVRAAVAAWSFGPVKCWVEDRASDWLGKPEHVHANTLSLFR